MKTLENQPAVDLSIHGTSVPPFLALPRWCWAPTMHGIATVSRRKWPRRSRPKHRSGRVRKGLGKADFSFMFKSWSEDVLSIFIMFYRATKNVNLGAWCDNSWWVYLQLSAANGWGNGAAAIKKGVASRMVKGSLIYINRGDTHNLALENLFLKLESVGSSQSSFVCLSFGGDLKCLELLILVTLVFEAASIGMTNRSRYRQQTMMTQTQTHKHKYRYVMIKNIYIIIIIIIYYMHTYLRKETTVGPSVYRSIDLLYPWRPQAIASLVADLRRRVLARKHHQACENLPIHVENELNQCHVYHMFTYINFTIYRHI